MGFERRVTRVQPGADVFGELHAGDCFHTSPECIVLTNSSEQLQYGRVVKYASNKDAMDAGHMRACERCLGQITVKIDGRADNDAYVRLTVEQLDVLRVIKRLSAAAPAEKRGLMHRDIAVARRCHVGTCQVLVRALRKKQLVKQDYVVGQTKARIGTIAITPLADIVLEKMSAY